MAIISISLNGEILSELDKLQSSMGFTGRSEIIRAGIRAFVQEEKQKNNMMGNQNAVLIVVHSNEFDDQVARIKHDFEDLIKTHLHNKIDGDRCMEMFFLDGNSKKIQLITNGFLTDKKMDVVKLVAL